MTTTRPAAGSGTRASAEGHAARAGARRAPRRNALLVIGGVGLALFALLAVVAPWVWGDEADALGPDSRQGPSGAHWLGTDALGRDVLARTLVATRLTLEMAVLATAIASVAGIVIGTAIWVAGPRVRAVGLRVIDVMVSYPPVILALAVAAVMGAGPDACVLAIGVAGSPQFARLTANLAASVAGRDFVATSRLLGVGRVRLVRRHILPNMSEPLLVLLSVAFAHTLTALSGLSFLGLGVQLPDYDWGQLLSTGLPSLYTNPAEALGPAVAIVLCGLCAGFVGDGLAASSDPRSGRRADKAEAGTNPTGVRGTGPATRIAAPADAVLAVEDLRVLRPDGVALVDSVSFHVRPGEIVGVVGESGSGKSLTAMAAAALLPDGLHADAGRLVLRDAGPTSGTAQPIGPDVDLLVARPTAEQRRRLATAIGIVYQDPSSSFNPALRLGGQLTETLRVHMGMSRKEADARAVEQLDFVKITDPGARLRQYPHELSGGMRQRAMIASALLTRPRLLIADEPTTALDVTVQAEVLDLLRAANERDGTAVLFISHDIGVVTDLCHRVLVMYAGRLVEELSAEDLREGRASHPYTQALIAATPTLSAPPGERLAAIPGRPPAPDQRPAGCAFADRCPVALPACATQVPPVRVPGPGRRVVCHVAASDDGGSAVRSDRPSGVRAEITP